MKDIWRRRYDDLASERPELSFEVLTAFNANIDRTLKFEDLEMELDEEAEDLERVETEDELKKAVRFCYETSSNREVDASRLETDLENGKLDIGGQAGIMANYLSNMEGSVTFYTPLLSGDLAEMVNETVLHPFFDEEFVLKNVRDAPNTDRTKENIIIEFDEGKSSRLILSDALKGFGPYFRSSIAENLDKIDRNIDRALLSGFHNVEGNKEAKIEKSRQHISKITSKKHLEMVDTDRETFKLILEEIGPTIDSIGLDETELKKVAKLLDVEVSENVHIGEAFEISQKLMDRYGIERVHIHTYRYHLLVTEPDYNLGLEDLRDSMLFGEVSALLCAENGRLPELEDFKGLDFEKMHIKNLDEIEEFAEFFELDGFIEKGFAEVSGYKVAAIPTLIHEEPERLVGMGDIISSGTYVYEISRET